MKFPKVALVVMTLFVCTISFAHGDGFEVFTEGEDLVVRFDNTVRPDIHVLMEKILPEVTGRKLKKYTFNLYPGTERPHVLRYFSYLSPTHIGSLTVSFPMESGRALLVETFMKALTLSLQ